MTAGMPIKVADRVPNVSGGLRGCLETRTGRPAGSFCAPVRRPWGPISPIVSPMTSCRDPENPSAALRRRISKQPLTTSTIEQRSGCAIDDDRRPARIVAGIRALKDAGADLILLGFPHVQDEIALFGRRVIPLVPALEAERSRTAVAAE